MKRARVEISRVRDRAQAIVRRHKPDYQIVLFMGLLVLIGLIVLVAISPARVELINDGGHGLDSAHFMQKQLLYLAVGLAAFITAAVVPLKLWQKYGAKILLVGFGACVLLMILGLFMDGGIILKAGGATRWFNIGPGTFQPAELLKFGILVFLAGFLGRRMRQGKINSLHDTLIPVAIILGAATLLIIGAQKDMGTGITMLGMAATMIFAAGLRLRLVLQSMVVVLALGVLMIVTSPHRMERVMTFFNPSEVSAGESYHIEQATIAIGSGGLTGRGLGQGRAAFGYVPEAVNDSIFAIFGETFGFIGVVAILAIFTALLLRLVRAIDRLVDPEQRLIMAGVFGLLMTHLIVNVGSMTGVFPLTGVTLPFLSFGGSSLLFTMLALGLAFQVSRYTTHGRQIVSTERSVDESSQRRRGVGRTRYTSARRTERA